MNKLDNGWSNPKPMGSPFVDTFCMYVSVADNGNIYFTGQDGIYVSDYSKRYYSSPKRLSENINSLQSAAHPFVAPDESYIIFDAQPQDGNADLYISFRDDDRMWSKAVEFDSTFNSPQNELCAFVSRDGKYLFFSRMSPGKGDIYWVDARIIEKLNPKY